MNRRKLDNMEQALLLSHQFAPFVVVSVVRMSNGPAPGRMRAALATLQSRQPALRARIVLEGGAPYFEIDESPPPIPLTVLERADDGHWHRLAEQELNAPFATDRPPLVRCHYLYTPGSEAASELILTFVHVIFDAISGSILLHDLLALSTLPEAARTAQSPSPMALLPPTGALFPPSFQGRQRLAATASYLGRQMAEEIAYRWQTRALQELPRHEHTHCRFISASLPAADTAAVARVARRRRVGLNSLLLAATLLAVNQHVYGGRPRPMRYVTFNNLRPFLRPPVPDALLGSYISMGRYTEFIDRERDIWPLAQAIHADVHRASKRGDKFVNATMAKTLIRLFIDILPGRMCQAGVSYLGPIPLQSRYGDTHIRHIHGCSASDAFAPEYSVYAKILFDRLCWEAVTMSEDMDRPRAQAISEDITATLIKAGQGER